MGAKIKLLPEHKRLSHGALIKALRKSLSMTQKQFGGQTKIHPAQVSQLELGRYQIGMKVARRLAKYTGIPARVWLGVSGE
jgi:transcriptional regulator with XRE-family HTH domain